MNRLDLIEKALLMTKEKYQEDPNFFILEAIIYQLEYLLDVIKGNTKNFADLKTIIIGRMTAYDIHQYDRDLADILYLVSSEADKMIEEYFKGITETQWKERCFLELFPDDAVMLYQPAKKPGETLKYISRILENYYVNRAFYSKISIGRGDEIMDFHLIILDADSDFTLDKLMRKFYGNYEIPPDFKFMNKSENDFANQLINDCECFYVKYQ